MARFNKIKRDFRVENHGSIILVRALTSACEAWLNENVGEESQYFGGALVVEPRYASDLVAGLFEAGFEVAR